ncbi:hypothetical protein M071_3506, partial [Bacteroides fragilis str. Ds-233]
LKTIAKRLAFSFYLCKYTNMLFNIKAQRKKSGQNDIIS